VVQDWKRS